jgi:parvulin-like peptidyl-prolyl isomerase
MRWHDVLGLSLMAFGVASSGCSAANGPLDLTGPAEFAAGPSTTPGETPGLARAQKPDGRSVKPAAFLDMPPDRSIADLRSSPAARIRAVVNTEPILDEEVQSAMMQMVHGPTSPKELAQIEEQALNQIIDREVLLQDAFARLSRGGAVKYLDKLKEAARKEFDRQWLRKVMKANNYTNEAEFKVFLQEHHMSLEMIRRQWERNFMAMEYIRNRVDPFLQRIGHADLVEYYEKHPEEFKVVDSVDWQDMFIATALHASREEAQNFALVLANRIRQGEDFARLATQYDNGDSALRNSEGQGHKPGEIGPKEAEPILFRMQDGEVGPLVEMPAGFHIIRLVKRQRAGMKPFDEAVQKQIKEKLRGEVFERETKRIVNELKRKAVIEIAHSKN